jgi:hypothetical protein
MTIFFVDTVRVTGRRLMGLTEEYSGSFPKRMTPDSTGTRPILIPWLILGYYLHSIRIYPEPAVLQRLIHFTWSLLPIQQFRRMRPRC